MIILQFSGRGDFHNSNIVEQVILYEDADEFEAALEDCEGETEKEKCQDLAIPGLTFDSKYDTDSSDTYFTGLPLGDNLIRLG